ncbi:MAG: ABC transporter substrate-binding protein [Thermodesulfobacteriota bacterium]
MAGSAVITIGHLKITDHLVLGIAQHQAACGVTPLKKISIANKPMASWQEVAGSLTDGSVDAAFVLAPTAMDLYKAGVKSKLLLFSHKAGSVLIKNKKANINSIEDFRGKVVIIPYQLSVHNMLLHRLLSEAGMEPGAGKDVLLEVMAPAQMPLALQYDEDGEIAGFIVAEPFGSQAVTEGYGEEFSLSKDIWPEHPCCVLVVRDEVIQANGDGVQELINTLVAAGKFVSSSPEQAATIGAGFLGQKEEVLRRVLLDPPDRITTDNLFPVIDDLGLIQDYMHDNMGVIQGKIDLEKFVDISFAKGAGAT